MLVAWLARFAVLRNKKKTFELEYENYAKQKVLHERGAKRPTAQPLNVVGDEEE